MKRSALFLLCLLLFTNCSLFTSTDNSAENSGTEKTEDQAKSEPIDDPVKAAAELAKNKIDPLALKKKILVLPFINRSQFGGDELPRLQTLDLVSSLGNFSDLTIMESKDLPGAEGLLNDYGDYQTKTIFEKCRANGISAVVMGSIEEIAVVDEGDEIGVLRSRYRTITATVKFQLMDVRSERPLFTKVASADVTDQTTQFFEGRDPASVDAMRARSSVKRATDISLALIPQYAKRINWNGRIAKVDVQRYYINAGEASGILKGTILKVFGDGEPVVDHETGDMIGMTAGRFKGTLKVVDFFAPDGAIAILQSGAGFREKDRVEVAAIP